MEEDTGQSRGKKVSTKYTDFPKKSLPSMMTLTFLNPILEREREVEESGTECVVKIVCRGT